MIYPFQQGEQESHSCKRLAAQSCSTFDIGVYIRVRAITIVISDIAPVYARIAITELAFCVRNVNRAQYTAALQSLMCVLS